tara:strand:- start:1094 stop:1309 length:216 start_codon:yes stop_codon:yes gene_type:complete
MIRTAHPAFWASSARRRVEYNLGPRERMTKRGYIIRAHHHPFLSLTDVKWDEDILDLSFEWLNLVKTPHFW